MIVKLGANSKEEPTPPPIIRCPPCTFEGHQPQHVGGDREEPQEHAQGDLDPYPTFTADGSAFNAMPQPNTAGAPQPRPLQPLHFSVEGHLRQWKGEGNLISSKRD